jgi:hypothetical protein
MKRHITGKEIKCFTCGNLFWKKGSAIGKFNFCSRDCFNGWRYSEETKKDIGFRIAESSYHNRLSQPPILNSKCFVCNKDIYKKPYYIKRQQHLFCSRVCKGKHWSTLRRENSVNWKGGVMDLQSAIRGLPENGQWIKNVFKKDKYTCQECGQIGKDLEAHHIKRFSVILKEFLSKYSQFSLVEDKETLVRLSLSCPDFWEISNGRTLCVSCHRLKERFSYGRSETF